MISARPRSISRVASAGPMPSRSRRTRVSASPMPSRSREAMRRRIAAPSTFGSLSIQLGGGGGGVAAAGFGPFFGAVESFCAARLRGRRPDRRHLRRARRRDGRPDRGKRREGTLDELLAEVVRLLRVDEEPAGPGVAHLEPIVGRAVGPGGLADQLVRVDRGRLLRLFRHQRLTDARHPFPASGTELGRVERRVRQPPGKGHEQDERRPRTPPGR